LGLGIACVLSLAGCSAEQDAWSVEAGGGGGDASDESPGPIDASTTNDASNMSDTSTIVLDSGVPESAPPVPLPDCADSGGGGGSSGPMLSATIKVSPGTTLATIGPAFVGLSYEKAILDQGLFRGDNAAAIAMFRLLGPGVLRVGGNSVDRSSWNGNTAGTSPPQSNTSQADVDALAAFAKAAGWTVIYGLNMKTSTPAYAADEASYAANSLGSSLYGFEIGNEVDLYTSTLGSPSSWSYSIFKGQWESFATAIHAGGAGAGAVLTGPASAANYNSYTVPFASDEGKNIALLTQHYYRGNGASASSTLAELMAPDPNLVTELKALSTATTSNGIPKAYRCSECNSFYNGGAPGVSDGYGTALWAIDFLFTNAQYGATGVNFHGGGNGTGYTPIADSNGAIVGARPVFYGMLLFTLAGAGPMVATTATGASSINFTAYAVTPSDGSTRVVLVNKDATTTVRAAIDVGKTVSSAPLTRLAGPSLDATSGLSIGGAQVTPTGTWTPGPTESACASGNLPTVDVPPASAVVVDAK
jgi:Glycosyl hydrolase family 79 C-terminal beta domain